MVKNKKEISELDEISKAFMFDAATERPFSSPLNDEYRPGIYVDKLNGEVIFSSDDKFDSGCGWPSFSRPINKESVSESEDLSFGMNRTEVKSTESGIHLGHVFSDGPLSMGGLRYCINGAALVFIPYDEMDDKGYSSFKKYVKKFNKNFLER